MSEQNENMNESNAVTEDDTVQINSENQQAQTNIDEVIQTSEENVKAAEEDIQNTDVSVKPKKKRLKWIILSASLVLLIALGITSYWYIDTYVKTNLNFVTNCDLTADTIRALPGKNIDTLPQLTREEYQFKGWFKDEGLTENVSSIQAGSEDTTVYAKWDYKGDGTEAAPFEIYNLSQFKDLSFTKNTYYILKSDIELDSTWKTRDYFSGHLNGNNQKIIFKDVCDSSCIFKNICYGSSVSNLNITGKVSDSFKKADEYGILTNSNSGTVENCTFDCTISFKSSSDEEITYAGFIGNNTGTVKNCTSNGTANIRNEGTSSLYYGSVVGENNGTIENCTNNSTVEGKISDVSGIAGYNKGTLKNCINNGVISVDGGAAGYMNTASGITAYNTDGTIEDCTNKGNIKSESTSPADNVTNETNSEEDNLSESGSAGIVSYNDGTVKNCSNEALITSTSESSYAFAGGITVTNWKDISDCKNNGKIEATSMVTEYDAYTGGICASSVGDGSITSCYNNGEITYLENKINSTQYSGGICGYNNAEINNSYNEGRVISYTNVLHSNYVGGVVAVNGKNGIIDSCYNVGKVIGKSEKYTCYAGGIAGGNECTISNTYAKCNIYVKSSGNHYNSVIGGILGYNEGELSSSYFVGDLSNGDNISIAGGIIGIIFENQSVLNCHWYSNSKIVTYGIADTKSNNGCTEYTDTSEMVNLADVLGAEKWKNADKDSPVLIWQE